MDQNNLQLKEIKPFLSGYISRAGVLIRQDTVPDEDSVHDIRVLMKKARAVLKLTGSDLETELYAKDLQDLRRVGQTMSGWRDTSVHRKSLKELRKEYPKIFSDLHGNEQINGLLQKDIAKTEPDEKMKNGIEEIYELLTKTGYRIRFRQMQKIDPQTLMKQLRMSYNIVANIYLECRNMAKPEKVHEFRKRSKDFLYQLYFFRPLNPQTIKTVEKRLERMTMYLGRYNDLYQLIKAIGYNYSVESNDPFMNELIIKIREKQDYNLSKVWPTAYKFFRPGAELKELLEYKKPGL